ncbi:MULTISPECIES: ABC transporter substrate-binding protein [Achromobacter]|jgi:ABC-type amino acid transport substrate-binding protein|uniref:ABC transporter arginine-binding protein 1 n=1 Tax=Achromobacter aegrifaciens TaxID=1287736 RepID=A0AAD2KJC0_ACHAE|nr:MULTISPECIES: ABC transporter substrate-binding protein [Achromobacter]MDQ1761925.1 ABC transporter substrate-binding protein [Achromobacter aegrifaciens]MDR7947450.1 ABC transporter substrate-binding protein [Achromobacter aegrifaciens]CAB3629287.1 Membrane-bound lytic murein transglycosylase F [Achromobacter aegrifaciens]CAB3812468.1 Membrane-bound lytic murein transglycosylase F [Achromobacter aegrifaciens]CAB3839360.1 Membrane-bound lytic murein transglycosylase F [Achromobacter aegrifa
MLHLLKTLFRSVRLAVLATFFCAASAMSWGAAAQAQTGVVRMDNGALLAPEFARIINRGELVVALLGVDQPPFFEERNGKLSGFDVDFAREIAQKLGVRVRFNRQAQTFDGVVTLLAEGQADLAISKLSRTLSRARVVSFSAPYLSLKRALLLNRVKFAQLARGRSVPEVIRAYTGTIGVVAKSSYADYVTANFPQADVRQYPTWQAVLAALDSGEVTAAYRDEFEVKRVLKIDPTASLRLRVVTLQDLEDTLGMAVNASDQALLGFINLYLADRSERFDVNVVLQATNH